MRYVPLQEAQPGMQLATEIFDSKGRTLVGTDIILTENYIERLMEYGYAGVYIRDELTEDIDIESAISPQLRTKGLECVRSMNIDGCKEVAESIVEEILAKGKISLDMVDLRNYDDYTYAHSVNVAIICGVIGMGMGMDEKEMGQLVTAALLHDLGKLSIPTEILNKPDRLTKDEYKRMKNHPITSYELVKDRIDISATIKVAVLFHHENVDGTGYPNGITGEEQTTFTKILHVADVYDALVSKRPYKEPYAPYEAIEYLMGGCGILFDQEVVGMLMQTMPLYPKGTAIALSDGREGIVKENGGEHNLRPIVRLADGSDLDLMGRENMSIVVSIAEDNVKISMEKEEARRKMMGLDEKPHIIAVDDMKTNLQALYDILKTDYSMTLMTSGKQLLKYLKENPYPDMILLDVDMPDMNGIETAERVMKLTEHQVPILFVSALRDAQTVLACRSLGVEGYVGRPYKSIYIRSEIQRILNRWE
ncbi:MAG: response regulator [Lachnospiraceae bacterium]|nr:response regulator [Lachnospiraceae bacterium]